MDVKPPRPRPQQIVRRVPRERFYGRSYVPSVLETLESQQVEVTPQPQLQPTEPVAMEVLPVEVEQQPRLFRLRGRVAIATAVVVAIGLSGTVIAISGTHAPIPTLVTKNVAEKSIGTSSKVDSSDDTPTQSNNVSKTGSPATTTTPAPSSKTTTAVAATVHTTAKQTTTTSSTTTNR